MLPELLPNVTASMSSTDVDRPSNILSGAALSFLGVGVPGTRPGADAVRSLGSSRWPGGRCCSRIVPVLMPLAFNLSVTVFGTLTPDRWLTANG
jgi:ABC-type dipeptide/oligopeptide/nickel transport system permease subunit